MEKFYLINNMITKKINFYHSFSELRESEIAYINNLSWQERLMASLELIRRVYSHKIEESIKNKRIIKFQMVK